MTNEEALFLLFPAKIIDEKSLTPEEAGEKTGMCRSQAERRMKDAVASGTWEQVFKRADSGRLVKSYRPKG
jgi:response regulator of citrate/malate metabolism